MLDLLPNTFSPEAQGGWYVSVASPGARTRTVRTILTDFGALEGVEPASPTGARNGTARNDAPEPQPVR